MQSILIVCHQGENAIRLTAISYTASRDYLPSLSAWIKKSTSFLLADFFW